MMVLLLFPPIAEGWDMTYGLSFCYNAHIKCYKLSSHTRRNDKAKGFSIQTKIERVYYVLSNTLIWTRHHSDRCTDTVTKSEQQS